MAGALCASCNRHVTTAPQPSPVFQQKVLNARSLPAGDHDLRTLRERIIAEPDNLEARLALANLYWTSGAPELAIDHYRFAAAKFPNEPKIAMLLARSLRDAERPTEAIQALESFRSHNDNPPASLLSLLGILQDDAGKFPQAEATYRAAIAATPGRADLHNNLGYNLLLQGKPTEAATEFREALKIEPRSQLANNNLAVALLAAWKDDSQPKEALLRWQSVSDPASAHNNLAAILIQQKRYADARAELAIALDYRKDHPEALRNLALLADLDGGSPAPPPRARSSFWKRVKTVFNHRSVRATEIARSKETKAVTASSTQGEKP